MQIADYRDHPNPATVQELIERLGKPGTPRVLADVDKACEYLRLYHGMLLALYVQGLQNDPDATAPRPHLVVDNDV